MMLVETDKMSALSSWELAQRLYDKNVELENKRRKSVQARIPSDPNTWLQMRENYEAIILEDHKFSEQHNIEYALWQLHYRRIEEFRAHLNTASSSTGPNTSQPMKGGFARPDRVTKIRLQFKTYLSEATGFYHDLLMKIKGKYGIPMGHFSDDMENRIVSEKDDEKSIKMKKGLISCHRCLIYLGDLARYKGLYGEVESKSRDYAAASSYYLQAASLWPSSGNPHHQLAIVATYSGDEMMAIYRYFRSLAAENPFSTARDNLIVAFEKNRKFYSQLNGDIKASANKESHGVTSSRSEGTKEAIVRSKEVNIDDNTPIERVTSIRDVYKSFSVRFVRLNGILFTRTSLETFEELLSLVSSLLIKLLSSGPEEQLNFGPNAIDNGLFIVRLVSILIFTVHNVKREAESQSYADILQRTVLLQNAVTAIFELMGQIFMRCSQLSDPSGSYLLPSILIFVEWLASFPDIASNSEVGDQQATVRSKFWNHCVSFFNKFSASALMTIDDEDEACFFNMEKYEEGETDNRVALWEDFELRGFVPLQPAQTILDFSRKYSFGGDGKKEKTSRVKRILSAGKALSNIVKVDQETLTFNLKTKKFVFGVEPQKSNISLPKSDPVMDLKVMRLKPEVYVEDEEEDEVIVFKPVVTEKHSDAVAKQARPVEPLTAQYDLPDESQLYGVPTQQTSFTADPLAPGPVPNINISQYVQSNQPMSSTGFLGPQAPLVKGLKSLSLVGNGHVTQFGHVAPLSLPIQQSVSASSAGVSSYSQVKTLGTKVQPKIDTNAASSVRGPPNRPIRHLGPPPGFSSVRPKQVNFSVSNFTSVNNPVIDDYSWLDGYQKGPSVNQSINKSSHSSLPYDNTGSSYVGPVSFPFPGSQVPPMQFQVENPKGQQDYQVSEQYQGESLWTNHRLV